MHLIPEMSGGAVASWRWRPVGQGANASSTGGAVGKKNTLFRFYHRVISTDRVSFAPSTDSTHSSADSVTSPLSCHVNMMFWRISRLCFFIFTLEPLLLKISKWYWGPIYTQKKYAVLWCGMWPFWGWCTSCHTKVWGTFFRHSIREMKLGTLFVLFYSNFVQIPCGAQSRAA